MKKFNLKFVALSVVTVGLMLLSACSVGNGSRRLRGAMIPNPPPGDTDSGTDDGIDPFTEENVDPPGVPVTIAGITTFRGILPELASEAGVAKNAANAITTSFNARASSLTASGEATSIAGDMTVALFELSTQFCLAARTRETANGAVRLVYNDVNFAATPANGIRANSTAVINRMTQRFWQRNASAAELSVLQNFLTGLTVPESTQGTADLALTLCAVISGSLQGFLSI